DLRSAVPTHDLPPSTVFRPLGSPPPQPIGVTAEPYPEEPGETDEDLAFASIAKQARALRSGEITSERLTEIYLERIERYGDGLNCFTTVTEGLAKAQAWKADQELRRGLDRGPLHGIPYGLKDLFATRTYPTTWGAQAYRYQQFDYDAAVVEKLEQAGAVLLGKTVLGALAWGDRWYGGRTNSPWDEGGSSGSSAGSAAATAAALCSFAIGTETSGSIVSPSHRCRVVGLRPTFGRVSRYGAMPLSWTLDKVGPITRYVDDAATVLNAIRGADDRDPSTLSQPFGYHNEKDLSGLKVGMLGKNDLLTERLERLGAAVESATLPAGPSFLENVLTVESAAAFDEATRTGKIDRVHANPWNNVFRAARFVTGVDVIQMDRARRVFMQQWQEAMQPYDLLVVAGNGGLYIYPGNLCGLPQVLIPDGENEDGAEQSISLIGKPWSENVLLAAAGVVHRHSKHYLKRPDLKPFAHSA
ncbi:MAG: amidase, partial [Fimbriimonadaceae bacterium]